MADVLFERYKDALRRGHVAALRGQLDVALAAYEEASSIAPDRPLPLTSLAGIHRRLGQDEEALAMFDRASQLVPSDLVVALGRAECLAALGHRAHAAEAFVELAETHAAEGHPSEAHDAARRALELAGARDQRGSIAWLVDRFRSADADDAVSASVAARAREILEPTAKRTGSDAGVEVAVDPAATDGAIAVAALGSDADPSTDSAVSGTVAEAPSEDTVAIDAEAAAVAGVVDAHAGTATSVDLADGAVEAARRLDAGDPAGALAAYRDVAAAHRREGQVTAALDACTQALAITPTDAAIHLDLVELYVDAGWSTLAADKLRLVARLVELDEDLEGRARLCGVVGSSFSDDPGLTALCA